MLPLFLWEWKSVTSHDDYFVQCWCHLQNDREENDQTTHKREKCLSNLLPVALNVVLRHWTAKYFNC